MRAWTIGFDADDTLWHNERFFRGAEDRFETLLAEHMEGPHLRARLLEAERRNLGLYGFGIKGFVLSMIETAVEVTQGRVPGAVVGEIVAMGRDMLAHPIELLPHAREAVEAAARRRSEEQLRAAEKQAEQIRSAASQEGLKVRKQVTQEMARLANLHRSTKGEIRRLAQLLNAELQRSGSRSACSRAQRKWWTAERRRGSPSSNPTSAHLRACGGVSSVRASRPASVHR